MLRNKIPPCAAAMGCLCAGHARGDSPDAVCNTDEQPARKPRPRSVQLKIMLTAQERWTLVAAADAAGESVSNYARRAVHEQMRRDLLRRQVAKTPGVG